MQARPRASFPILWAHPEIRFGCDFDFSAATASDFTKSPQRSTLATFAGFLLIVLVSLENPKSRFQNEFPDVPLSIMERRFWTSD
jgi:hypothetical protein